MGRASAFTTAVGNDFIVKKPKPRFKPTILGEIASSAALTQMTATPAMASYQSYGEVQERRFQFHWHTPAWMDFIERHKLAILTPLFIVALALSSQMIAPYWYDRAYIHLNSRVTSWLQRFAPPMTINGHPVAKDAITLSLPASQLSSRLSSIVNQHITLNVGNGHTTTLNPSTTNTWVQAAKSSSNNQALIAINPAVVASSLSQIAEQYVTRAGTSVVANENGTQTVIVAGTKGVTPLSSSQLASEFKANSHKFLSGKGFNLSLMHAANAGSTTSAASFGKLLDVNLTSKHLYAFENGQQVNTFPISAGASVTPTPTGEFHILQKTAEQTLNAPNPNGTVYYQPHVQWLDYFNQSGDAISGSYWLPASYYGLINNSRGSVLLTNPEAEWVYNWAAVGTTVIVHN